MNWHKLIETHNSTPRLTSRYVLHSRCIIRHIPPCPSSLHLLVLVYISPKNSPCKIPAVHFLLPFPCRALTALSSIRLSMTGLQSLSQRLQFRRFSTDLISQTCTAKRFSRILHSAGDAGRKLCQLPWSKTLPEGSITVCCK